VTSPKAQAPSPTPPAAEPTFGVQVSAYRERTKADADGRRLSAQLGLPYRVVQADLGAKGVWFRVIVGESKTATEASALGEKLRAKGIAAGAVQRLEAER
jgi:cell division protein FtsN